MKSDEIITKIRKKMKESDPERRTVTNIFQFIFTDSDGKCIKKMVFDFKDMNVYEGICSAAEAEIKISDNDFYLVGTHHASFEELIANKKVHVHGDADAINKLLEKFRMNPRK